MKQRLQTLINCTLDEVTQMFYTGRIDCATYQAFRRLHSWMAPRWGGMAGVDQEAFWNRFGEAAYLRKMNGIRAAFGFTKIG